MVKNHEAYVFIGFDKPGGGSEKILLIMYVIVNLK